MACFHPLTAGRYPVETHGRTKLSFGNAIEAGMTRLKVGCGQCLGCRLDHSLRWATRCMHESKSYEDNSFITLTYSDEHLPIDMSLSQRDVQLFTKRLRKRLNGSRPAWLDKQKKKPNPEYTFTKIFYCGEYSPKRATFIVPGTNVHPDTVPDGQRPHYHACVFGYSFPDKELWSVRDDISIYSSDFLADIWGKGFCTVGDLTYESAAYVARYTVKKLNGSLEKKPDEKTGLLPYERVHPYTGEITKVDKEFAAMSNGIGLHHLNRYRSDIYPADHVIINGHETRPPRYYDDKYRAEEPEVFEEIIQRRMAEMENHAADNTPARLAAREKVKMAQLQMLKRDQVQ